MQVVWDARKAVANLKKHRVSFEEASTHSVGEARFITFGESVRGRVLAVAHTDDQDMIRIISARAATRHEKRFYEEG